MDSNRKKRGLLNSNEFDEYELFLQMMDPFHIDDKNILNDDEPIQTDNDSTTGNSEEEIENEEFENDIYDLLSTNNE